MWVFDFFLWKTDAYDSPASARSSARSRSASTMANLRATCINDTYTRFFPYVPFLSFSLFCNTLGFFLFLSNSFRFANPCLACLEAGIWAKIDDLATSRSFTTITALQSRSTRFRIGSMSVYELEEFQLLLCLTCVRSIWLSLVFLQHYPWTWRISKDKRDPDEWNCLMVNRSVLLDWFPSFNEIIWNNEIKSLIKVTLNETNG